MCCNIILCEICVCVGWCSAPTHAAPCQMLSVMPRADQKEVAAILFAYTPVTSDIKHSITMIIITGMCMHVCEYSTAGSLCPLSCSVFIWLRILKCLWGLVHECQHWSECLLGENLPYKHGVFMEYRWCSHIAESCCRLSATCIEQSSREMKSGDSRETGDSDGNCREKAL